MPVAFYVYKTLQIFEDFIIFHSLHRSNSRLEGNTSLLPTAYSYEDIFCLISLTGLYCSHVSSFKMARKVIHTLIVWTML
jgi:hypothetical protein